MKSRYLVHVIHNGTQTPQSKLASEIQKFLDEHPVHTLHSMVADRHYVIVTLEDPDFELPPSDAY